jgi:hypothetical protein
MSSQSSYVYNGKLICPVNPGKLPGPRKVNEILLCMNAFLAAQVQMVDGDYGDIIITDANVIIQVPRGGGGGAGSGGVTMMSVVSYNQSAANGDYLVCTPPTGPNVNVAVEPQLQSGLGYQTSGAYAGLYVQTMPDTNVWSYTAYSAALLSRTSSCIAGPRLGTVLTEFIAPPFIPGDVVPVWGCANTGVKVAGVAAAYIALTGRQWAAAT